MRDWTDESGGEERELVPVLVLVLHRVEQSAGWPVSLISHSAGRSSTATRLSTKWTPSVRATAA